MKITSVKDAISGLLKSKGISLYDGFSNSKVEITKNTAFIYPPSLEKEKRVLYPNGTQVNVYRHYRIKLEITGTSITSALCSDILKLIDSHNSFHEVKLSEVAISKVTSLPHFFVSFTIIDGTLEAFTKKENEMLFNGLSVHGFIDGFNLENDILTPQVTLADGSEYYGTPKYRNRVYTLKIRFSPALREGFIYSARSAVNSSSTVKIDNVTYNLTQILKAQIVSSDNYETTATLTFTTA